MLSSVFAALILGAGLSTAVPLNPRAVKLDPAATAEAQQRDGTATRAFTAAPIKTADGSCLSIDPTSGDFRENLTPLQVKACDGTPNQQFDVITAGKHLATPGSVLIVSSLTNACLDFDPRRAAGNQVFLFSCGGRADGTGAATVSQAYAFAGGNGPFTLVPGNTNKAVCLTVKGGVIDQTACNPATASGNELFSIGSVDSAAPVSSAAVASVDPICGGAPPVTSAVISSTVAATTTSAAATLAAAPTSAPATTKTATSTSTVIAVSRAGSVLNPSAVAESQPRDNTATRAFSAVAVKTSDGQCLDIDPTAGDFRENLIPVTVTACNGSPNQQFDVITAGKHNNVAGAALIVSTSTNACLNFDPRRAAGDQVILFSCGGRADGSGAVTNSQLFDFKGGKGPLPLVPQNGNEVICLVNNSGKLDTQACTPASASGSQLFSFA